jgi:hypothetical protein
MMAAQWLADRDKRTKHAMITVESLNPLIAKPAKNRAENFPAGCGLTNEYAYWRISRCQQLWISRSQVGDQDAGVGQNHGASAHVLLAV